MLVLRIRRQRCTCWRRESGSGPASPGSGAATAERTAGAARGRQAVACMVLLSAVARATAHDLLDAPRPQVERLVAEQAAGVVGVVDVPPHRAAAGVDHGKAEVGG